MARHGVMHQKIEAHKRYMAKHRFENVADFIVGEPHLHHDYIWRGEEITTECTIDDHARCVESVDELRRQTLTNKSVAPKDEIRRVVKWGKRYYGVYHGAELVRLIPANPSERGAFMHK